MKVINAKCNKCSKTFKCYGKYDSTIIDCDSHNNTIVVIENGNRMVYDSYKDYKSRMAFKKIRT